MTKTRAFLGCLALVVNLVLFSAGTFLNSKPYVDTLKRSDPFGLGVAPAVAATDVTDVEGKGVHVALSAVAFVTTFAWAMCLYTPINVAFLTVIAGFLGGCASNITYSRAEATAVPAIQAAFRRESPFALMIRSFIVYLALIAGIYITFLCGADRSSSDVCSYFAQSVDRSVQFG